jgi:hypothetical protein
MCHHHERAIADVHGLTGLQRNEDGGVSNVDMDGNNALYIKAIQVFISTFETLPANPRP